MSVIHKHFMLFGLVFYALLAFPGFAHAQDSLYTVEGVEVDATAANAVAAREKAFEEAQVKAFAALAERLLTIEELAAYPMPDAATISGFVQDFEVTNEQLSAVRYKGVYTFRFRPSSVETHLSTRERSEVSTSASASVNSSASSRKPVLVLPFMLVGTRTVLWDDNNPFMAAFARAENAGQGALVPTIRPLGDLEDVSQIRDDQALNYDKSLLAKMTQRYDAQDAVILLAERRAQGGLTVSVYSTQGALPEFLKAVTVEADPQTPEPMLFDRAVAEVQAVLKETGKKQAQQQARALETATLKARARFSSVQEWVRLKRAIESVSGVSALQVQGIKPKEAVVEISYAGGLERLTFALSQAGVGMTSGAQASQNQYNPQIPGATAIELQLLPGRF